MPSHEIGALSCVFVCACVCVKVPGHKTLAHYMHCYMIQLKHNKSFSHTEYPPATLARLPLARASLCVNVCECVFVCKRCVCVVRTTC